MTQKAVLPEADARRLLKACGLSRATLWDTEVLIKKLNTLLDLQGELTPPADRDLALLYGDCIQALQEGLELDLLIEEPPAEPPQSPPAATTTTPKKAPQRKAAARARQATKPPQEPPADTSNTPAASTPKKAPRRKAAEDPSGVVPSEPPQETPAAPPARQSKKAPQKASADTPRTGQERLTRQQSSTHRGRVRVDSDQSYSRTALVAWMGRQGWSFAEARFVCDALGQQDYKDSSVRTALNDGAHERILAAVVTAHDARKLDEHRRQRKE